MNGEINLNGYMLSGPLVLEPGSHRFIVQNGVSVIGFDVPELDVTAVVSEQPLGASDFGGQRKTEIKQPENTGRPVAKAPEDWRTPKPFAIGPRGMVHPFNKYFKTRGVIGRQKTPWTSDRTNHLQIMKKQNDKAEKERSKESLIDLRVEELEPVVAPRVTHNHNETLVHDEIELAVEELEEVIAPRIAQNHNETLVCEEIELAAEELEAVIAPRLSANHNETLVSDEVELAVEALEEMIAPRITFNHNETIVHDEVELAVEELEEVIAPRIINNHNETLVREEIELAAEELEEVSRPSWLRTTAKRS
jgi:hypothetical protein